MLRRTATFILIPALLLSLQACRRIDEPIKGAFPRQSLIGTANVQSSWGTLVGSSSSTTYPDLVQLWFQDAGGTVRMVSYSLSLNEMLNVTTLPKQ